MRAAGVGDIENLLVGREREAVRLDPVADDQGHRPAVRIDAIDVRRADLGFGLVALVVAVDAVGRIGEPDRAIRLDHQVVRRVQLLALEAVGQHGDRAVMLGARHTASAMLAGDEPAFVIGGVAIGVVARLAKYRHRAVGLVEPHQPVVRNVRPDKIAAGRKVRRPLGPAHAGMELVQQPMADDKCAKSRIVNDKRPVHDISPKLQLFRRRNHLRAGDASRQANRFASSGRLRPLQPELLLDHVAHDELLHLAGHGHRKLGDELDVARDLVVGDLSLAEGTHLLRGQRLAGLDANPGAQLLAIAVVGDAEHLGVLDLRMLVEILLDLARIEVLAAADHHVLDAADDVAVALVVDGGEIAGVHPAAVVQHLGGLLRFVPVAQHDAVAARAQFTGLAARHDLALEIDDLHLDVRMNAADRRHAPFHRSRSCRSGS